MNLEPPSSLPQPTTGISADMAQSAVNLILPKLIAFAKATMAG